MSVLRPRLVAGLGIGALVVGGVATTAAAVTGTTDLTDATLTPQLLAEALVGPGVTISNVTYTGAPQAAGTYSGGLTSIAPADTAALDTGVVLSSGAVATVIGPNNATGAGTGLGQPGDAGLDALAGQVTYDAAVLQFDFTANADTVYFQYVFGSEEYPEYVDQFNDVFAFWVNGVNCAVVPDPADPALYVPVSINTINAGDNAALFVDNTGATANTQLDGFTVPLTCMAAVNPAPATNTMRLAISDARDSVLDTAVFLAEGSLSIIPPDGTAKVTGGGRLDLADGFVTVGTNAIRDDAGLHGNLQVNDHRSGDRFHGDTVTALSVTGDTAVWSGTGRLNGEDGYSYEVTVTDNRNGNSDKKGSPDTVSIVITDGGGATVWELTTTDLTRGNMTVHDTE